MSSSDEDEKFWAFYYVGILITAKRLDYHFQGNQDRWVVYQNLLDARGWSAPGKWVYYPGVARMMAAKHDMSELCAI